jgi:hypothetical protein
MSSFTADQMLADPSQNTPKNGHEFIVVFTVLATTATSFVALRFLSKRLTHHKFTLDDYLCLAALLAHHVLMASSCVGIVQGGIGRNMDDIMTQNPDSIVVLFQSLFAADIAYTLSSPLIKLAVLAFYYRIFPTQTVRMGCWVLAAMCMAWAVAVMTLIFVQCRPLEAVWYVGLKKLSTTRCLDPILRFLSNSIANTVIDFFILLLPIQEIVKLQTTARRKVKICFVFVLGGIAFASSMARTIAMGLIWHKDRSNSTIEYVISGTATVVEIYIAIIGACLPLVVPVYNSLRHGDAQGQSSQNSQPKPTRHEELNMAMRSRRMHFRREWGSLGRRSHAEGAGAVHVVMSTAGEANSPDGDKSYVRQELRRISTFSLFHHS